MFDTHARDTSGKPNYDGNTVGFKDTTFNGIIN